jgi:two-component system, NtrC family, response regulator AtoC
VSEHVSDLQWDLLLADELPTDVAVHVRAHAAQCVACSRRRDELIAGAEKFQLRPNTFPFPRAQGFGAEGAMSGAVQATGLHQEKGVSVETPLPRSLQHRPAMVDVDARVARFAPTAYNVLLLGESGVGKGVIAERIHRQSIRAGRPLRQLNCATLITDLLESQLFGHERGAFTGAMQFKQGLLEEAAGGTVFFDEVGEMPLEVQAKLLLVIEQRVIQPVGGTQYRPIDVRFIFATNRDLVAEIDRGRFHADFYHRINDLTIRIPPLRERRHEIDGFVSQFAAETARSLQRERPPIFDEDALAALHRYDWPGNIRELHHVVRRAILLSEGDVVTSRVLVTAGLPIDVPPSPGSSAMDAERDRVIAALTACGGNQSRAAKELGISRNTLIRKLDIYRIRPQRLKDRRPKDEQSTHSSSKDARSARDQSEEDAS